MSSVPGVVVHLRGFVGVFAEAGLGVVVISVADPGVVEMAAACRGVVGMAATELGVLVIVDSVVVPVVVVIPARASPVYLCIKKYNNNTVFSSSISKYSFVSLSKLKYDKVGKVFSIEAVNLLES